MEKVDRDQISNIFLVDHDTQFNFILSWKDIDSLKQTCDMNVIHFVKKSTMNKSDLTKTNMTTSIFYVKPVTFFPSQRISSTLPFTGPPWSGFCHPLLFLLQLHPVSSVTFFEYESACDFFDTMYFSYMHVFHKFCVLFFIGKYCPIYILAS